MGMNYYDEGYNENGSIFKEAVELYTHLPFEHLCTLYCTVVLEKLIPTTDDEKQAITLAYKMGIEGKRDTSKEFIKKWNKDHNIEDKEDSA